MDDPLKQKAVPLAAETVLWFEFLLDPNLITKHLNKANPDPNAMELMAQFITLAPDTTIVPQDETAVATTQPPTIVQQVERLNIPRKSLALKTLALKVCTWLKWNLDALEKSLNIRKQMALLRDMCTISFGKLISVPLAPNFQSTISPDGHEHAVRFALTFYHRWVLRLQIIRSSELSRNGAARAPNGNVLVLAEPGHPPLPEISPQTSVGYLQELCQSQEPFHIFTFDTFVLPHAHADETKQNFADMKPISPSELRAQIYFDLVNYYLFSKQYELAREAVCACRENYNACKAEYASRNQTTAEFLYTHLKDDELEGYLMACGVSSKKITLHERFNRSQFCQFKDIVDILKQDNRERIIPFVNRRIIELDIEACISQEILPEEARRLAIQVGALNVVRSVFDQRNICHTTDYFAKYRNSKCVPEFIEAVTDVLPYLGENEKNQLKSYIVDCILTESNGERGTILQQITTLNLFTNAEIDDMKAQITEEELPNLPLATMTEWKFQSKLQRIETGSNERQLISCSSANTVRKLLVKLAQTNPTKPLWTVNPSWEIATPIKSLLMSMPRGFLQDFAYVLLGKARELTSKSDYVGAVSMLTVLKSETTRQELASNSLVTKLGKLVNWEILLIQITQSLEEWNRRTLDQTALSNRCKQCLNAMNNSESIIPRIEIIDSAALLLLNMTEWNALLHLDKRLPQLELYVAYAATALDIEKRLGPKKVGRDAWDLILAMFQNTTTKRGAGGGNSRSSPCLALSQSLQPFLKRIRSQTLFALTISILGKIHNILKDDPNHDLNGEYMQFWPTSISNPIGYSIRSVSETLHWLLTEALKYYPQTIVWLKMKGDLEMAIGNNEAAMRCYVNALITGTEYCSIPLQRSVGDDYVIRKMIRCSSNLGCHMQATVLCQFLEEIDYGIVFKNLIEKSANFSDAMDAYYNCIWDTTLLEFIINLHAKKSEHGRKLEAISIMGTLELNANNNEEIKREATAIRKQRFLRALAKQYLM